jgi:putative ABC transport system permease protein
MKFSDLFLLSTRMFKARTSRTFLTILGMSVGIGAILFLVSLGYGLQKTLLEKITTSDSLLTLDVSGDRSSGTVLDGAALESIGKISGVAEISPAFNLESRGNMNNLSTDLAVSVISPTYLKFGGVKVSNGELLSDTQPQGVIISSSVAKIFNIEPEEIVGKPISFIFYLEKEGSSVREEFVPREGFTVLGVIDSDDSSVYVNAKALASVKAPVFAQFKVKCQESKIMPRIQEEIVTAGFSVSSLSDTVDQANKIFSIVKIILMLFGFIALVVSAIGMFNTMTITLLERTEEIGIMKSIGASDGMISMMFIMEATIMGFLGGLVGIIIGWLEGNLFNFMINLIATHFGGEKVSLFYSPLWFVMSIIIFSAFVGFLTGVVPARRASGIDPLEALRYK